MKTPLGTSFRRRLMVLISLGVIGFVGLFFNGASIIRALDDRLLERRMAFSPRPATGEYALIAIDKESLDKIGVWPWPRSVYANIVRELVKAGARDIAFDIDFSVPSTPANDEEFAKALDEAGGGVILAAFLQHRGIEAKNDETALTSPIPLLAEKAWIGAVNVVPDRDGLLRSMPYSVATDNGPLQSLPSMLAGLEPGKTGSFLVDYSISSNTIPMHPLHELLSGSLSGGALRGKSVVIGASAVELKDYFTVPVQGTISGPLVQILATETLAQGRVLSPVNPLGVVAAASAALAFFFIVRPRRLSAQFLLLTVIGIAFEATGYYLFDLHALWLQTAGVHIVLAMVALGRTIVELDVRRLLLRIAALETRNTRQILEQVITDNSDAILIADETGRIVEMSVRVSDVFQPPPDLGPGDDMADVLPAQLITETRAALDAIRSGIVPEAPVREVLLPSEQGERCIEYSITPSRLETPDGPSFVVCIAARDVTLRRQQEAKLDRLSRYDELTGALRQSEFVARLDRILSRETRPVAVYSLNLHRFKTINTTLGREVGDELLSNVVRTLKDHDAGVLLVGRTGSDSFCLAHLEPGGLPEAEKFADSLIRVLGYPFIIGDNRATIGIHIGIAVGMPDDPMGGTALLESAEFALDKAREINGSGWTVFDPAASQKIISTRQIERELWRSLERNEIFVTYQPQVDLNSRELIGAEALVRWNNPEFGMISPAEFVEIAEANGFVEKLGEWVLRRACEDAMTWEKPISVAVNVSPLQFSRGDVVGAVKRALNESKLPASRLHLEITESIFLYESADLAQKLKSLRALGVSFALDDFGTGYSSFGYIAHFPPDKIKVDKLFVQNLRDSAANRAILRSVRSLCEGLGVLMICEGVESEDQMAFLRGIGCEQGQGWLFGKAESNDVMRKMAQLAPADAPLESRLDENGTVH